MKIYFQIAGCCLSYAKIIHLRILREHIDIKKHRERPYLDIPDVFTSLAAMSKNYILRYDDRHIINPSRPKENLVPWIGI